MVKKIVSVVLVSVFLSLSLSGCGIVKSFFTYWDGLSESEAREYIEKTLEEKYGEEFLVISMGIRSGQYYKEIVGTCSPKSDETIAFDFEVNCFNKNRQIRDNYIQNIVRKELKQNIDNVLRENYDAFASEVFVTSTNHLYDSGIRLAEEATTEKFSRSFVDQDTNETSVWIALTDKEKENGVDKLENMLLQMIPYFYSLNVYVEFYYTNEETIKICNEKIYSKNPNHWEVDNILNPHNFPVEYFAYFSDEQILKHSGNEILH